MTILNTIIDWCNINAGFVGVLIFITSIFLGWISGFFKSIIRKPKFKIRVIPGPTICTTFPIDKTYKGHQLHRTAISIYLNVANTGTSPSSIEKVWVGYRCSSISYYLRPFWLKEQMVTLQKFQYDFGDDIKIYPSLLQGSALTMIKVDTYLEIGKNATGVVYFEQDDSWCNLFPAPKKGKVKLFGKVIDTFGGKHK